MKSLVSNARWLVLASLVSSPAWAQEPAAEPASGGVDLAEDETELNQKTDAEDELAEPDAETSKPAESEVAPEDGDESTKYSIGLRYRTIVVPKFLINAFGVDGAADVIVHGVGPQFGIAKENFEIILSPWYAGYGLGPTPFKGPGDGQEAWEMIESRLHQIYITADLLWRKNIVEDLDWTIGVSGGLGIVFGSLARNETYWTNGFSVQNPGNPYVDLAYCPAPGNPDATECPLDGNYGTGEAWPVYPWLAFQTGVRWQPHENFIGRLDLGGGSSGFFVNIGADYGL